jgi:PAS domain S-box-containing protein
MSYINSMTNKMKITRGKDIEKDPVEKYQHLMQEYDAMKASFEKEIAELKLIVKKVSNSEEKFRKAFITTPDSININRLEDGMYVSINKGFSRISGYAEEEVIGKTSIELNIWANPDDRDKLVKELRKKGEVENLETEFLMKNGTIRNGIMSASIIDLEGVPHILSVTRDITEIKNASIALQKSENRYRALIELAADGILLGSNDGTIIGANTYFLKLSGRSLDQLLGKNIDILFSDIDLKNIPFRYDLLRNGKTVINERQLLKTDGNKISVEMHTKMMPDGTYQSIFHDITNRKEAEKALRESEEWFRNLFEQSTDGIFYLTFDGNIITVNKSFADMHGYAIDEVMKMNIMDIGSDKINMFPAERLLQLINGESLKFEVEHFHKDGHRVQMEVTARKITMGSKDYIMASHRDITLRNRTYAALRESEEKLQSIFRVAPVGIGLVVERVFMEVNDTFCKLTGYSRDELIGNSSEMIYLSKNEFDYVGAEKYKQISETGTGTVETKLKSKDGRTIDVIISSSPIDKNDMSKGITFTVLDITERIIAAETMKLAKEKAEASDKLKTTFLNNISHEVRTPLNGILGFAEIMSHADLSEHEKKESLSMLHESNDRLLNTINNYVDTSLIVSGNLSVNKKDFSPDLILNQLYAKYKNICSVKNLELSLQPAINSEKILINSDPDLLIKVLSHLMNNALKFTERGIIRIGFDLIPGKLKFFVSDTGKGIGNESIKIIFDQFVKGDEESALNMEGSGLGLSIAKGIVELLGEEIQVVSEIGKGSVFSFTVPYLDAIIKRPSTTLENNRKDTKINPVILIAEDDEANFYYINALLKHEFPSTVIHAIDGIEAEQKLIENPDIDLVLMDLKMPGLSGFEATRRIKAINKGIPIIAITAYAMPGDDKRAYEAGCDGYIAKPVNKSLLLEKIREFIKR